MGRIFLLESMINYCRGAKHLIFIDLVSIFGSRYAISIVYSGLNTGQVKGKWFYKIPSRFNMPKEKI